MVHGVWWWNLVWIWTKLIPSVCDDVKWLGISMRILVTFFTGILPFYIIWCIFYNDVIPWTWGDGILRMMGCLKSLPTLRLFSFVRAPTSPSCPAWISPEIWAGFPRLPSFASPSTFKLDEEDDDDDNFEEESSLTVELVTRTAERRPTNVINWKFQVNYYHTLSFNYRKIIKKTILFH